MTFPPETDSWPYTPLAMNNLPAIQRPDFIICDRVYAGSQGDLKASECTQAAGRLPVGSTEVEYQRHNPYFSLTTMLRNGRCQVEVEEFIVHGPDHAFMAKPDLFRDRAAEVIRQCVIPRGHGGFATVGIQNLINWATDSGTTLDELLSGHVPPALDFFTVNVVGGPADVHEELLYPASTDPVIAYELARALDQASQAQPHGSALRDRYERGSAALEDRGDQMDRSGNLAWYNNAAFAPVSQDHMVYECDSKLGVPMSADCSQLAYSELGPPSDTVAIGPNAVKFLSSKTCNVAITASINLVLTWRQIKAALDTLINTCVMHPLLLPRGGRAYAGRQSTKQRLGSLGRRKTTVTGLNALSPHVNITLFQQAEPVPVNLADELKTCTWGQVEKGGNIRTCVRS